MARKEAEIGETRNFRDFTQEIGIKLGQEKEEKEARGVLEFCDEIGCYPDTISEAGGFVNFKAVEERQFFGRQIGMIAVNGWVLAKTKTMDWHRQYRYLCCYGSAELALLLTEGRVWQSEDPKVLLVRWGNGSVCGVRDYINNKDHQREPLPIDEPKRVCFEGEMSEKTGAVLIAGQYFLVILGNWSAEELMESVGKSNEKN